MYYIYNAIRPPTFNSWVGDHLRIHKRNRMLAAKLDTLQNARNPKGTRSPKGSKLGAPFGEICKGVGFHGNGNFKYRTRHETITSNGIEQANPPSNFLRGRLPPRTGRFRHGGMTCIDESNAGDNLHDLDPKDKRRSRCPMSVHGKPRTGRNEKENGRHEKHQGIKDSHMVNVWMPCPPTIALVLVSELRLFGGFPLDSIKVI